MIKNIFVGLFTFVFLTAVASSQELKITAAAPPNTPWLTHINKSADAIAAATDNEVTLKIFPSGQLGNEFETIKQVASGRIDGGYFSIAAASIVVPEVALITSPFFWDSAEQADCVMDRHMSEVFDPLFEERGLRITQWGEVGWQIVFSKEQIASPSDIKGMKMRIAPVKVNEILWRAIGSAGVPLSFADTAPSLQTGIVDAGELPTISYIAGGVGKIAPHMTSTRHIYQPSIAVMNLKSLESLSTENQKKVYNNMSPAGELRDEVRASIKSFEDRHVEEGGSIRELDNEERAEWAAMFTDEMQQMIVDGIGGEAQSVYDALLAARADCTP